MTVGADLILGPLFVRFTGTLAGRPWFIYQDHDGETSA